MCRRDLLACCLGRLMMMRMEECVWMNEWVFGWSSISISHIISRVEWVEERKTRKKFNFSKWHIITVFWVPSMHRLSCTKEEWNEWKKSDRRYAMMMRRHIQRKPQRTTNHVVHALRSFYDLSLLITKIIASKKYWLRRVYPSNYRNPLNVTMFVVSHFFVESIQFHENKKKHNNNSRIIMKINCWRIAFLSHRITFFFFNFFLIISKLLCDQQQVDCCEKNPPRLFTHFFSFSSHINCKRGKNRTKIIVVFGCC